MANETPDICESFEGRDYPHCICGCGNQPPFHCMYCCLDLSPEQIAKAVDGWAVGEECPWLKGEQS